MLWLQDLIVRLAEIILRVRELERINAEGYEAAENQEPLCTYDVDGRSTIQRNFVGKWRYLFVKS